MQRPPAPGPGPRPAPPPSGAPRPPAPPVGMVRPPGPRSFSGPSSMPAPPMGAPRPPAPPTPTSRAASLAPGSGRVPIRQGGPMSAVSRDDLKPCRTCGRRFATDRVGVHEAICAAMGQKKRRPFDPKKQRLAGTPAEQFNRVGAGKQQQKGASAKSGTSTRPQSMKKPDWRRKHEDFINTIRAAKEMKAHIAAGGKVSDLPPPPRSDYSDYINCPHCGRNFNQTAAERHIPRCATMEHNKPNRPQVIQAQKEAAAKRR